MIPMPVPLVSAPEPRGVPLFAPLRVSGGRERLRRALRRRHRAWSAGLVLTAAALVAWAPPEPPASPPRARPTRAPAVAHQGLTRPDAMQPRPSDVVSAPVRIADAATVRLLEPGDRVDVIATDATGAAPPGPGGPHTPVEARVVAAGVRVTGVPEAGASSSGDGALIVLAVPRATATALAGAAAGSELTVTLC